MIELLQYFFVVFAAIFVIINPITTSFVFLGLLPHASHRKKVYVAKTAVKVATVILFIFTLIGSYIFSLFGISIAAFRIAGGIILFSIAMGMIRKEQGEHNENAVIEDDNLDTADNIAIIPLAIPFMSGPGAIATVMILTAQAPSVYHVSIILLGILITMVASYYALLYSEKIVDFLGETGKRIVTKVFGLILSVIAIQFILNGILDIIPDILLVLGNI